MVKQTITMHKNQNVIHAAKSTKQKIAGTAQMRQMTPENRKGSSQSRPTKE